MRPAHSRIQVSSLPAVLLFVALAVALGGGSASAGPRANGLSYLVNVSGGCEWRVFDPVRGTEARYLTFGTETPRFIQWDSTFTHVGYVIRDSIYDAEWTRGARPRAVAAWPRLEGTCDWWFDENRLRWRLSRTVDGDPVLAGLMGDGYAFPRRREVWESSRDGATWRRVSIEDLGPEARACGGLPADARATTLTLGALEDDLVFDARAQRDPPAPTYAPLDEVEPSRRDAGWYYVPLHTTSHRSLVLRVVRRATKDAHAPIYLVDLEGGGPKRLLFGAAHVPLDQAPEVGFREAGDYLLVASGRAHVIDVRSGLTVFTTPPGATDAVWVGAFAP